VALTIKQERYCQEFVRTGNMSEAYRRAYDAESCSAQVVANEASKLFKNPEVMARVVELQDGAAERAEIDASYVLRRLREIDEMDCLDILDDDGNLLPVRDWPKVWRQFIGGFELVQTDEYTALKKIKWPDKVKNLELLGKHLNVGAFVEKRDLTSSDGSMSPKGRNLADFYDDVQTES